MGRVGVQPSEFWEMEVWEMQAAITGYQEERKEQFEFFRNHTFSAARFNAACTAMSQKASRKISAHRFPWEKGGKMAGKKMSFGSIKTLLTAIAKVKNEPQAS